MKIALLERTLLELKGELEGTVLNLKDVKKTRCTKMRMYKDKVAVLTIRFFPCLWGPNDVQIEWFMILEKRTSWNLSWGQFSVTHTFISSYCKPLRFYLMCWWADMQNLEILNAITFCLVAENGWFKIFSTLSYVYFIL